MRGLKILLLIGCCVTIFSCDQVQNVISDSSEVAVPDSPAEVSTLTAVPSVDQVTISWENEGDLDFTGIQVLRSETDAPKSIFDGVNVYTTLSSNSFVDSTVQEDTTYYYRLFYQVDNAWVGSDPVMTKTITKEDAMALLVQNLSAYVKGQSSSFQVVTVGGLSLLSRGSYLSAIDGVIAEGVNFTPNDDSSTKKAEYTLALNTAKLAGKKAMVLDYAVVQANIDASEAQASSNGFISFQRPDHITDFLSLPTPHRETLDTISNLSAANNFAYIDAPVTPYPVPTNLKDYDVLMIDLFTTSPNTTLSGDAINSNNMIIYNQKQGGNKRLVFCVVDIGRALSSYYYFSGLPDEIVLTEESGGVFEVKFWSSDWQEMLFGNDGSYLKQVINSGFDGVVLKNTGAFED